MGNEGKSVSEPLNRNFDGTRALDVPTLLWKGWDLPGFETKTLFEDPATGESTVLMRVAAGASADLHSHETLEEVFVLAGTFSDQHRTYHPGDYCARSPGTIHTAYSDTGCDVLLIYRPARR